MSTAEVIKNRHGSDWTDRNQWCACTTHWRSSSLNRGPTTVSVKRYSAHQQNVTILTVRFIFPCRFFNHNGRRQQHRIDMSKIQHSLQRSGKGKNVFTKRLMPVSIINAIQYNSAGLEKTRNVVIFSVFSF